MGFELKIDTKNLSTFLVGLKSADKNLKADIKALGPTVAEIIERTILKAMEEQMPIGIGKFMIDRTAFDTKIKGGNISVLVRGMSEGEAGNPERLSGGRPKVSSPEVNLWNVHEYGLMRDESEESQTITKDIGGVVVFRDSVSFGHGSPYQGMIRKIVSGLDKDIADAVRAAAAIQMNDSVADTIESASKGKIKVDRSAVKALNRAKVSLSSLAKLKVIGVETKMGGQINLRGAGGRFVSGKGQVPTTINK